MNQPPRLSDDPEAPEALRDALEAGRSERPDPEQLASLAAKLGPLLGPPGGGGGPPVDPTVPLKVTGTLAAKALGGLAAMTAGVAAVVLLSQPSPPPPRPPSAPPPQASPAEPPAPDLPSGVDAPEALVVEEPADPPPRAQPRRRASAAPPSFEIDPGAELALIRRSQEALRGSPSRALELTAEHARRFGPGTLAQEREVVAIDALHQLGRDPAARARAERFAQRWPRSAHLRRIEVILGAAGP